MMKSTIAGGAFATLTVLLTIVVGIRAQGRGPDSLTPAAAAIAHAMGGGQAGQLYGRVTMEDGDVYEGRLRFGGDEEALWGNYFNGYKDENPWVAYVPEEQLPRERVSWSLFGIEIGFGSRADLGRPFMARFGDIARIEARGRDLWVTLRSGTVVHLDRYAADDYADGVRVWDRDRGVMDLGERQIRSIELLPAAAAGSGSAPLQGRVRTRHGEFTGLVQWNREAGLVTDQLRGQGPDGEVALPFDAIRSIARRSGEGALVTLLDGRQVVLTATRQDARPNRGMYVDDPRYGRVLISWEAFERLDFSPGGAGPTYHDFRPGRALTGTVVTRSGRRFSGRLVYDLDESESTATLDAPAKGVDYTIPFNLIASIEPRAEGAVDAKVTLHSGGELQLERTGDLAESNAGLLVFPKGSQDPEYVAWSEVAHVEFDRSPLMNPSGAP